MTITELVLLILNFTSCIVCLWLSLLKQKLNTARSMCNVERVLHCYQGWGQVQYLYLVLVLKYIFIST